MLDDGYDIPNSGAFATEKGDYLDLTLGAGNTDVWTLSLFVKRTSTSANQTLFSHYVSGTENASIRFWSDDRLRFATVIGGVVTVDIYTDMLFRDTASFYHLVLVFDSTEAVAADRYKVFVNGVSQSLSITKAIALNEDSGFNLATNHRIGKRVNNHYLDGYLSETHFIDGQALTPDDFAQTDPVTGQWVAKAYQGTYGTNGFYLNFQNGASLGEDSSGNGNDFTNTGVTQSTDTPTDNQCTLNYLSKHSTSTISVAGTEVASTNAGHGHTKGTIGVSSGKWYWEYTGIAATNNVYMCGISLSGLSTSQYVGEVAGGYGYYGFNGNKLAAGAATAYGASYTAGDIIGVALDMDTGDLEFFKNNVSQGVAFTGLVGTFHPSFSDGSNSTSANLSIEFPEASWTYAAPTGFKALSTKNLPEPVITKPTDYFAPIIYDDGAGAKTVGFQPDLVWMKARGATTNHKLVDSVRGVTKSIESNTTAIEATEATGLTSFDTNGFTVGADTDYSNTTGTGMVAWSWKEGITQGFDIVEYTPATGTQNHSLGVTPSMIIEKRTVGTTSDWIVGTTQIDGSYDYLKLNLTNAKANAAVAAPTSTLFTPQIGTGTTAIAYLFAEIEGFSKIDSYIGNGSTDGPFAYCGFRPAYVMIKSAAIGSWGVFDVRRNEYNTADLYNQLQGTAGDSSAGTVDIDILSNGFKIRGTGFNGNAIEYLFLAFAESPFKYSRAR